MPHMPHLLAFYEGKSIICHDQPLIFSRPHFSHFDVWLCPIPQERLCGRQKAVSSTPIAYRLLKGVIHDVFWYLKMLALEVGYRAKNGKKHLFSIPPICGSKWL
jgi:hypothetical protein